MTLMACDTTVTMVKREIMLSTIQHLGAACERQDIGGTEHRRRVVSSIEIRVSVGRLPVNMAASNRARADPGGSLSRNSTA
jgi:hypothetical protein